MRIALVVHDFNRSFGHGRYVAELATRFAVQHEVHVFANTVDETAAGVRFHHVPALRASALSTILSFYPSATLRLPEGFDIVHAQGFSVRGANVVTAHISNSRWMATRREMCGGRLPWRERLFGAVVSPLERRALQAPGAAVIAVSAALKRELQEDGVHDVVVIPHGVDTGQFNPSVVECYRDEMRSTLGCGDDTVFLFVGDLRKGFSFALTALQRCKGRLVAVSRSDPAEMLARARELGLEHRVRIYPATAQIERWYAAADVFVFPTQYDAFGMVLTEAMACGIPVITTGAAGASDLIEHGRTGFVIADPDDVGQLTTFMRSLSGAPSLRRQMGEAAAEAMQTHSWDSVAKRTLAVYEQMVTARTTAAA